jgi:hypothetical protein
MKLPANITRDHALAAMDRTIELSAHGVPEVFGCY